MNILDTILAHKKKEVAERKEISPIKLLEQAAYFRSNTFSLREHVRNPGRAGIIAEIKRKSPSKGVFHAELSVDQLSMGYVAAGASALSVLTDTEFFGGSVDDLLAARKLNSCPILRKDFIIDEYQVIEAKAIGADAILLIAAALPPAKIKELRAMAKSLGLEVLLEVHNEKELLDNVDSLPELIGVNNRDLKTFVVSLEVSKQLSALIPNQMVRVSESGIDSAEAVMELCSYGFEGFLIGQKFMETPRPEETAKKFIEHIHWLRDQSTL